MKHLVIALLLSAPFTLKGANSNASATTATTSSTAADTKSNADANAASVSTSSLRDHSDVKAAAADAEPEMLCGGELFRLLVEVGHLYPTENPEESAQKMPPEKFRSGMLPWRNKLNVCVPWSINEIKHMTPLICLIVCAKDREGPERLEHPAVYEYIKIALELGADPNMECPGGYNPLMAASNFCNPRMIRFLVARGADPRRKTRMGQNAFHTAGLITTRAHGYSLEDARELTKTLMTVGTEINCPDKEGLNPIDRVMLAGFFMSNIFVMAQSMAEYGSAPVNTERVTEMAERYRENYFGNPRKIKDQVKTAVDSLQPYYATYRQRMAEQLAFLQAVFQNILPLDIQHAVFYNGPVHGGIGRIINDYLDRVLYSTQEPEPNLELVSQPTSSK